VTCRRELPNKSIPASVAATPPPCLLAVLLYLLDAEEAGGFQVDLLTDRRFTEKKAVPRPSWRLLRIQNPDGDTRRSLKADFPPGPLFPPEGCFD